ncbi:UNVERIFIED_ORG: serine/threonine protein kinase [Bacillus sp. AZ43]
MSVQPPVVPGYVLGDLLGRGGTGEVWRAEPRRGGEPVAVKVLVAGDPERQAREAALLGRLDHPHLVRLIEVVHQPRRGGEARVALVLELLAGGSLAALLSRRGRLRPGEVVTAIAPVAAALAHAHDHGVVHGDLSPGNIVFTAEGRPVLTDLGVARVLGDAAAAEVTPPYVDPTVARGGAPGPASDVFGVAAAAFHALTGIAPWNAATPADTLVVAAGGHLPDLAELAPGAPPELLGVIARGLAPDPDDRGSAAAFALDLRHACRPEPVRLPSDGVPDLDLARTGAGPRTELTHQVPGRRHRPAPLVVRPPRLRDRPVPWLRDVAPRAGVVVGVLVALVVGGWVGIRGGEPTEREGAGARVAAVGSDLPAPAPAESSSPADRQEPPGSLEGWRALVAELYARRAAAFAAGSADGLGAVYVEGSPLRGADEEQIGALVTAGEGVRGFAPEVVAVTSVRGGGDRIEVDLVDRWPGYEIGPPAGPGRPVAGRPDSAVRLGLERTAAGWRIESAQRLG